MKHITRWTPDTHDCVVEYEWDDAVPQEEREHTFVRFVKQPSAARFAVAVDKFSMVVEENKRKNEALKAVLDALPENEKVTITDENGQVVTNFKSDPKWSLDNNGDVQVELVGEIAKNKAVTRAVNLAVRAKLGSRVSVKE